MREMRAERANDRFSCPVAHRGDARQREILAEWQRAARCSVFAETHDHRLHDERRGSLAQIFVAPMVVFEANRTRTGCGSGEVYLLRN